jgi:hypothetical protein
MPIFMGVWMGTIVRLTDGFFDVARLTAVTAYRHCFHVNACVQFSMLKFILAIFALKYLNRICMSKISVESS